MYMYVCKSLIAKVICIEYHYRGFSTGIHTTSNAKACHHILKDSQARIVVVTNQEFLDKVYKVIICVYVLVSYVPMQVNYPKSEG